MSNLVECLLAVEQVLDNRVRIEAWPWAIEDLVSGAVSGSAHSEGLVRRRMPHFDGLLLQACGMWKGRYGSTRLLEPVDTLDDVDGGRRGVVETG